MKALAEALAAMPHPFEDSFIREYGSNRRRCLFCGAEDDKAIHSLAFARRHGFDWKPPRSFCQPCGRFHV